MAKRKPNKAEREYITKAVEHGCVICQRPGEWHHMLSGAGMGRRASHMDGFCLCPDHHRNGGHGVAIHAGIVSWEDQYGDEMGHVRRTRDINEKVYGGQE